MNVRHSSKSEGHKGKKKKDWGFRDISSNSEESSNSDHDDSDGEVNNSYKVHSEVTIILKINQFFF